MFEFDFVFLGFLIDIDYFAMFTMMLVVDILCFISYIDSNPVVQCR